MEHIKTFDLSDKALNIGDVFTPLRWAEFAIEKFGIFQKWLDGATIFDPTMGEGNLLEALISYGIKQGFSVHDLPTQHLFGNELNTFYFNKAIDKFDKKYGLNMVLNFSNEDFLTLPKQTYNIIFGNPPWQNFVDLPETYKAQIKSYFFKYDLVSNSQSLLLGGSRIDIAALIIQIAIKDFLKPKGEAVIFMPLSLLLNDGANRNFRTYSIDEIQYAPTEVYDFNDEDVFGGVATRYGLTHFARERKASFPIPYYRMTKGQWTAWVAKPMFHQTDPLSILSIEESLNLVAITPIKLKKESSPRQGVNSCGANEVYFFDSYTEIDETHVLLSNKQKVDILLPKQFIFPLITAIDFKSTTIKPNKWVLLPYNTSGKPLDWAQIIAFPALENYLNDNKTVLQKRKGVMLKAMLNRGFWWALFGVGEYSFFNFKIVWEAYGKETFNPKIFEGNWQANQSLQAFIPLKSYQEAKSVLFALSDNRIEHYLLSHKMQGTMNWAQPGRIKKLLTYEDEVIKVP